MLMTGQSRTAFHGVPCIITSEIKTGPSDLLNCPLLLKPKGTFGNDCTKEELNENSASESACSCNRNNNSEQPLWTNYMADEDDWLPFSNYLSKTRININIRQVHRAPDITPEKKDIDINPT